MKKADIIFCMLLHINTLNIVHEQICDTHLTCDSMRVIVDSKIENAFIDIKSNSIGSDNCTVGKLSERPIGVASLFEILFQYICNVHQSAPNFR